MAFAFNGSSQYLISSSALTPLTNFSVYLRFKLTNTTGNKVLFVAGDTVTNNENYILVVGGTELWVGSYNGGGDAAKITGLSLSAGVYYDILGTWNSSTERIAYNGTTRVTDTTSVPLTSTNRTVFASDFFAGAPGAYFGGSLCDMAIWGTGLLTPVSDLSEVNAMFKGVSPQHVRPQALTDYWSQGLPAGNAAGIKGNVLTATNSNTHDSANPRIYA